jgi:integrase
LNADISPGVAARRTGIGARRFMLALSDVHNSAMMIVLLLTGMRVSEVEYLQNGCIEEVWLLVLEVQGSQGKVKVNAAC